MSKAPIEMWLAEPPDAEVRKALERLRGAEDVARIAVLPDVHLAKGVCIGVALATETLLYPEAVGGDIGCGMAAVRFDADAELLTKRADVDELLRRLADRVPVIRRPAGTAGDLPLPSDRLSNPALARQAERDGRLQIGTLGRGNHFLEFQADDDDRLWLMVHSGSRAMGQLIQAHHLRRADKRAGGLRGLLADSDHGRAYLGDVAWGLDYAAANRARMLAAAAEAMAEQFGVGVEPDTTISCHHNAVERATIAGRAVWLHRKGVISARAGEPGLVPGSMGSASYHVEGRGLEASLLSSSHGAGRVMSRSEARRRITPRALEKQMQAVWFDRRLTRRLVEEAPSAYKDITAVMRAQKPLTRIVRKLRPLLSYKGA